jgi:hypothetical protein
MDTRDVEQLQEASKHWLLRKDLRQAGGASIFFGLIAIAGGIATLDDSSLNAIVVVLGVLLVIEGVWIYWRPTPSGLLAEGVTVPILGIWNISASAVETNEAAMLFFPLGIFQLFWGVHCLRRYKQLAASAADTWSGESVAEVDTIVNRITGVNFLAQPNAIGFRVGKKGWRGELLGCFAVFLGGNQSEIVVVRKEDVEMEFVQRDSAAKTSTVLIRLEDRTMKAVVTPDCICTYEAWKSNN